MTKASDNAFPSILIVEGTEPTAPAAGHQRLYVDSTSHALKIVDSSGTESYVAGGGSSAPGYEFDYAQFTSGVNITATTEATATTIVTAGAVTYDGSTIVKIEAYIPSATKGTTYTQFWLYDGSSSIGAFGVCQIAGGMSLKLERRLTPSAAAHTYSLRASVDGGTGTATGGAGGAGAYVPGFIRQTKV